MEWPTTLRVVSELALWWSKPWSKLCGRASPDRVETPAMELPTRHFEAPAGTMQVMVASTAEGIRRGIAEIRRRLEKTGTKFVGMDAEWKPGAKRGDKSAVALLQLATEDGFSLLVHLYHMTEGIPPDLTDFLKDTAIWKLGVEVLTDAERLESIPDGIGALLKVKGCLELKFLADIEDLQRKLNKPTPSLEDLAVNAGIPFEKDKQTRESDWESLHLNSDQQKYAAQDALIAPLIFLKLLGNREIGDLDEYIDKKYSSKDHRRKGRSPSPADTEPDDCDACANVKVLKPVKLMPVDYEKSMPDCLRNWDMSLQFCKCCQKGWFEEQRTLHDAEDQLIGNRTLGGKRSRHGRAVVASYDNIGHIQLVRKFLEPLFTYVQSKRLENNVQRLPRTWTQDVYLRHRTEVEQKLSLLDDPEHRADEWRRVFGPASVVGLIGERSEAPDRAH